MKYMAVANRCAVELKDLHLPISRDESLAILISKGFTILNVDIIALAQECVGVAKYRRGARLYEAPEVFDCSSFIKWLYAQRGIWLPRRSVQQRELGEMVFFEDLSKDDIIFVSGYINYYINDRSDGVGHVGIYTGNKTVIHAANKKNGIIESSVEEFIGTKFRGIRRYTPKDVEVITLQTPEGREIESADDIKWIILQSLDVRLSLSTYVIYCRTGN